MERRNKALKIPTIWRRGANKEEGILLYNTITAAAIGNNSLMKAISNGENKESTRYAKNAIQDHQEARRAIFLFIGIRINQQEKRRLLHRSDANRPRPLAFQKKAHLLNNKAAAVQPRTE